MIWVLIAPMVMERVELVLLLLTKVEKPVSYAKLVWVQELVVLISVLVQV
jgi:hypothetical protein